MTSGQAVPVVSAVRSYFSARESRAWLARSARSRSQKQVATNAMPERARDLLLARVRVFSAHVRGPQPLALARSKLGPERDFDAGLAAVDSNAVARDSMATALRTRRDLDEGPLRISLHDVEVFVEHEFLNCLRSERRGDVERSLERRVGSRPCASTLRERDERSSYEGHYGVHALRVGREP